MKTLPKIFDETVAQPLKKSSKKSAPSFKPSILGSPCERKVYYSYNKVPEEIAFPLKASRIVQLGNYIGDLLIDTFRKAGIVVDYVNEKGKTPQAHGKPCDEFPISSPELGIKKGYIDMVSIADGELWLSEFKSSNSFAFGKLRQPKPDHLVQGVIYLYVFNKMLREGKFKHIKQLEGFTKAEGMRFLYYNKDNSTLKEFVLTTADEIFIEIVNKTVRIKEHTKNGTLPPATPDWCNSCPWQKKCSRNEIA